MLDVKEFISAYKPERVIVCYKDLMWHRDRFDHIAKITNTEITYKAMRRGSTAKGFDISSVPHQQDVYRANLILVPTDKPHIFKTIKNRWGSNNDLLDIIGNKRRGIKKFKEYINDNN
jgi:hypothetical protein